MKVAALASTTALASTPSVSSVEGTIMIPKKGGLFLERYGPGEHWSSRRFIYAGERSTISPCPCVPGNTEYDCRARSFPPCLEKLNSLQSILFRRGKLSGEEGVFCSRITLPDILQEPILRMGHVRHHTLFLCGYTRNVMTL